MPVSSFGKMPSTYSTAMPKTRYDVQRAALRCHHSHGVAWCLLDVHAAHHTKIAPCSLIHLTDKLVFNRRDT
eukprot:361447-Chlamydomonas_euryale.AAC.3